MWPIRPPHANATTVAGLLDLAEQQSALRRVATLVARGVEPEELFDAIAAEASRLIGVDAIRLTSYDPGACTFTEIAATHGPRSAMTRGPHPLEFSPLGKLIAETAQPVRIDDWSQLPGPVADRHRGEGFGQAVGAPIIVGDSVWGYIGA